MTGRLRGHGDAVRVPRRGARGRRRPPGRPAPDDLDRLVVALLVYLLLQAATGTWRGAAVLLGCLPLSVLGGVLVAPFVGGIDSVGVLAGLVAVLALAVRQFLVLVRRAQQRHDEPDSEPTTPGIRGAARELAPSVVGTALVVAAVLIVPVVMGNDRRTRGAAPVRRHRSRRTGELDGRRAPPRPDVLAGHRKSLRSNVRPPASAANHDTEAQA